MKYSELKKSVLGGAAPERIYMIYGTDDYLKAEASKLICSLTDGGFDQMNVAYLTDADGVDSVIDALETYPVFADLRVVFFTLTAKLSDKDVERLKTYLADPPAYSVLVIRCDQAFAKAFKVKGAVAVECSELSDDEIAEEIAPLLSSPPSKRIDNGALSELVTRTRRNMSRIVSEIEKLKFYSEGDITIADVKEMVVADLEYQIYKLTEAVASKNAAAALTILTHLLENGVKPKAVIDNLYERFRRLLHVSLARSAPNDYFAKQFGVSAGAVYYLKRDAEAFTQVKLKSIVDYLHGLQCDILMGKRQDESAMHEAILTLMQE